MKTIKTIVLVVLIGIFTSCEKEEVCESNCYNVVSMEVIEKPLRIDYLYILSNDCTGEEVRVSTNTKGIEYMGQPFIVGRQICDFNTANNE